METTEDGPGVPVREGPPRLMACSDYIDVDLEESDRSNPNSDDSLGFFGGACQTCLSVCQADCCQLLLQYKAWKSPAIVEGIMFVLFFAYGFMLPVSVQYIYERIWQVTDSALANRTLPHPDISAVQYNKDSYWYSCRYLQSNTTLRRDATTEHVLDNTAEWDVLISFARNFPPVFVSLAVVSYSDIIGRRFGLAVPVIGSVIAVVFYIVISVHSMSIEYLIVASIINGIFGSIPTATGCAYAYISDTVPTESRTFRFSLFASIRFAALGLSYMLSSYFIKHLKFGGTFVIILLLLIFVVGYTIFVLPESCEIGKNKTFRNFNPVVLFISSMLAFSVFTKPRNNPKHRYIIILLLVMNFFESAISNGGFEILSRYVVTAPFCADSETIALFELFVIALAVAGPFVAIKLLSKRLPDAGIGLVASTLSTIGLFIQGFSSNYASLVLGLVFQLFVPIPNGVSRSIMSKLVDPEEQGALQASVTSVRTLGGVASTYLCIYVFQHTVRSFPGIVFIFLSFLGLLVVLSFVLTWRLQKDDHESNETYKFNLRNVRRFAIQRYREIYGTANEQRTQKEEGSLLEMEDYDSDEVFSQ